MLNGRNSYNSKGVINRKTYKEKTPKFIMKNLGKILLLASLVGFGTASASELPKGFEHYQESKCDEFKMKGSAIVKIKGLDRSVKLPFYGIMSDKDCDGIPEAGVFYVPDLSKEPIATWSDDNENGEIDSGEMRSNVGNKENFDQIVERKLKLNYGY